MYIQTCVQCVDLVTYAHSLHIPSVAIQTHSLSPVEFNGVTLIYSRPGSCPLYLNSSPSGHCICANGESWESWSPLRRPLVLGQPSSFRTCVFWPSACLFFAAGFLVIQTASPCTPATEWREDLLLMKWISQRVSTFSSSCCVVFEAQRPIADSPRVVLWVDGDILFKETRVGLPHRAANGTVR